VLASMNTILYERQLEEYYCTLLYTVFDFKRRTVTLANAGLPYPIRKRASKMHGGEPAAQIELPGVPLGSFSGSNYDEVVLELNVGDLFVFFSDGVTEAQDLLLREFGSERLLAVVDNVHDQPARAIVDAIFNAVTEFRGDMPPNDDTTAVVVKITG
jgi:sigma-B regulation protein RsbU (phosphoserine phosphatase)